MIPLLFQEDRPYHHRFRSTLMILPKNVVKITRRTTTPMGMAIRRLTFNTTTRTGITTKITRPMMIRATQPVRKSLPNWRGAGPGAGPTPACPTSSLSGLVSSCGCWAITPEPSRTRRSRTTPSPPITQTLSFCPGLPAALSMNLPKTAKALRRADDKPQLARRREALKKLNGSLQESRGEDGVKADPRSGSQDIEGESQAPQRSLRAWHGRMERKPIFFTRIS